MRSPTILPALFAALFPACVVEDIEGIIAKYEVTYGTTESGTGVSSSTGASSTTGALEDTAGDASTTGAASGSMDAGETHASSSSSGGTTGAPDPVCGDGIVAGDEECDDANAQDADACRNDCTRRWLVFVTSEPFVQGDFGGITGADYECRHRATKMFLPNGERYMAWISTATVQPADRMYHARGPYVLANGLQVAANWDALTSGTLERPISVTEKNETIELAVWTGTDVDGLRLPGTKHCSDWTSTDFHQYGWAADSTATDAFWTRGVEVDCGAEASLYCVEQP